MSETAPFIARAALRSGDRTTDAEAAISELTAAGYSLPLVEARIVNEDMEPQPADGRTRGELVLRAPWLTPSYRGDAEATSALWRGGWLHTQDIATMDSKGRIRITDRLKDVIKTGGEWIDSSYLEELIAQVPEVGDAAVVAVSDERWGERPFAFVVPAPGMIITL